MVRGHQRPGCVSRGTLSATTTGKLTGLNTTMEFLETQAIAAEAVRFVSKRTSYCPGKSVDMVEDIDLNCIEMYGAWFTMGQLHKYAYNNVETMNCDSCKVVEGCSEEMIKRYNLCGPCRVARGYGQ